MAFREGALRADLQQHYGIDLDGAVDGAHTARHVAALVVNLPRNSRLAVAENPDMAWSLTDVLLAALINSFRGFVWGMSDPKRRGNKPDLIGPSWMTKGKTRSLPARVLPIEELMKELNKPRRR